MSAAADPWVPVPLPVAAVVRESADVVTLTLDASAAPLRFAPGQFTMVCAFGHGEVPLSISGDPAAPERLVHTVRAVGRVTRPLCAARPGDWLGVRGPFGAPWPAAAAEGTDVVLVAGGVGLAPLRPLLYHLLAHRERYGRVFLLYGARSPADLLFVDELRGWRSRFDLEVEVTVDSAGAAWRGPVGVVTGLMERAGFDADDSTVLTCGPEVMMRFVVREALSEGVAPEAIYLSLERNMHCGFGHCGHCQWGPAFVCRDGPVFRWDRVAARFQRRGL